MSKIYLINNQKLKPHEQIRKRYLIKLARQIKRDGLIKKPIIVDRKTWVILDGHHRFASAKLLGWPSTPAHLVNYHSEKITVRSWRKNIIVTKKMVLSAGLSGNLLKPKTSKHKEVL
ncbi:MAG: ParB N-terminal domain-containing protein [Patescibacteria group bacterium]